MDMASKNEFYDSWKNMLDRCYNKDSKSYKNYGKIGVTVCDRWHCFEYYLEDVVNLKGYDKDNVKNLEIDKDILVKDNKVYAPEFCMFVSKKDRNIRNKKPFIAISPDGLEIRGENQYHFADKYNLSQKMYK